MFLVYQRWATHVAFDNFTTRMIYNDFIKYVYFCAENIPYFKFLIKLFYQ
jgi:hypothetical protein